MWNWTLMHHAIKIAPTCLQTQNLVSCCQSWSNVTSTRQWRLKHYLTLVHLHVSLTRSWSNNLSYPWWRRSHQWQWRLLMVETSFQVLWCMKPRNWKLPLGHIQAKLFSMSFPPPTNPTIIGLFWFNLHNLWVDCHIRSFHFEAPKEEASKCKALFIWWKSRLPFRCIGRWSKI